MLQAVSKANKIYASTLNLTMYFSVFILFSMIMLPLISSYVNVGSALIRFTSLYRDVSLASGLILAIVGILSLLLLSLFVSAVVSIVKLKETLDQVGFSRVADTFKKYVMKVFFYFLMMSVLSLGIGVVLTALNASYFLIQLVLFLIWIPFVFTPQILIIEDLEIFAAMRDAWYFVSSKPAALLIYFAAGIILVFLLLLLETFLGQYFVWEHKLVSIVLLSLFILPYLEMLATELYIRRYAVSRM